MKTKLLILFLITLALVAWRCNKEKDTEPTYSAGEILKISKSGGEVSVAMVNQTRKVILEKLIQADLNGQDKTAQPKPQDTTGIDAIFMLSKIATTSNGYRVWHRLKIFNGQYQPPIHSMCYIIETSQNLTPLFSTIQFELQNNFIDFPPSGPGHSSVIYHAQGKKFYLVFFDLNPFFLDWADRIILQMTYYDPSHSGGWITVDRSDPNNYALSSDGYVNYNTYFFPDTLNL